MAEHMQKQGFMHDRGDAGRLFMARDLRRTVKRGHPWLFRDAFREVPDCEPGAIGTLLGRDNRPVARGYIDPVGPLTMRILTTDPREAIDDTFVTKRLARAFRLRTTLFDGSDTTGYRLVNGEGDGLPGLVIDRYGDAVVIKTDGPVAEAFWHVERIARFVADTLHVGIVHARARSRGGAEGETLVGRVPDGGVPFLESGIRWNADIVAGQKTGFFLDQREPRAFVRALSRGARVLNTFGYTGGFSVAAGVGGARVVHTVDIAQKAVAEAQRAWIENGLPAHAHTGVAVDAFEFLASSAIRGDRWDIVVLDPPAFAVNKKSVDSALAAYRRLIEAGARVTNEGGILLAASCSAHVGLEAFIEAIEEGLSSARRVGRTLRVMGQPPDHPAPLTCSELRYLKAVFLQLDA